MNTSPTAVNYSQCCPDLGTYRHATKANVDRGGRRADWLGRAAIHPMANAANPAPTATTTGSETQMPATPKHRLRSRISQLRVYPMARPAWMTGLNPPLTYSLPCWGALLSPSSTVVDTATHRATKRRVAQRDSSRRWEIAAEEAAVAVCLDYPNRPLLAPLAVQPGTIFTEVPEDVPDDVAVGAEDDAVWVVHQ